MHLIRFLASVRSSLCPFVCLSLSWSLTHTTCAATFYARKVNPDFDVRSECCSNPIFGGAWRLQEAGFGMNVATVVWTTMWKVITCGHLRECISRYDAPMHSTHTQLLFTKACTLIDKKLQNKNRRKKHIKLFTQWSSVTAYKAYPSNQTAIPENFLKGNNYLRTCRPLISHCNDCWVAFCQLYYSYSLKRKKCLRTSLGV